MDRASVEVLDGCKALGTRCQVPKQQLWLAKMASKSKAALGLTIFITVGLTVQWLSEKRRTMRRARSVSTDDWKAEGYVTPPLPHDVVRLLQASRLCHLGTQSENNEPHLSLMNFTYYQQDEVIIFGTSRATSKFTHLKDVSRTVAILIHDFPHLVSTGKGDALCGKSFSITLKGHAEITLEGSEQEERYRKIHLAANPDYAQFSSKGAIVIVRIARARLCDIHDKVTNWEAPKSPRP